MHKKRRTVRQPMEKIVAGQSSRLKDTLVVEEPLTILWQSIDGPSQRLSATMRTPGDDNELAAGLLFSEGLLRHRGELEVLSFCVSGAPNELNRLRAQLRFTQAEGDRRLSHRPSGITPQSACGMCGFDELSSPRALLRWAAAARPPGIATLAPSRELLDQGLLLLDELAPTFAATGASHTALILSSEGTAIASAEDVGRHNACDKAIGGLLLSAKSRDEAFTLPAGAGIVFSSRLSFELAAKAVRAGAAWMASVGAPTHLAAELAQACAVPMVGFLTRERHNVYV